MHNTDTHRHTDKWTHMDTDVVPHSNFVLFVTCMYAKDTNFIFGMPLIHKHMHTHLQRHQYRDTDTCTQTYISTHADIHRHTCIFFTYTNTHIYVSSQFFLLILYLVAICHMSSGPHGPIFFYAVLTLLQTVGDKLGFHEDTVFIYVLIFVFP